MLLSLGSLLLLAQAAGAREAAPSPRAAKVAPQSWDEEGCGPFSLTQTYGAWGPARHYEESVTVVYDATRCSRALGDSVTLTIEGVAVVYPGTAVGGDPLDERPFFVTGEWTGASNPEGWPPDWWECEVESASYTWQIAGVYTFQVSARHGQWNLDVSVADRDVQWSYDACG